MRPIILASQSPRRKYLLSTIFGDKFKVHVSNYDESKNNDLNPEEMAKQNAVGKARDVAKHYDSGIIIAADVFVVFNNEVLGKPKDEQHAFDMLKKQSGKWIDARSGVCVIDIGNNKEYYEPVITKVKMAKMTDDEIKRYVKTGDAFGKAGSFGMQDKAAILVEKIDGCYSNVVGLSLPALHKILKKIGVKIFDY
jgi:septum formation protein